MKVRLRHVWDVASSGFWFVPTLMTAGAAGVAFGMLSIDRYVIGANVTVAWFYSGGSDGAKTLLSTVAGSVITTAGVVFSITIAALTQASSQFGPRLLRNFMRDTSNQVVLGTFVATFLYCLLVLRTIHGKVEDGSSFVPQASITGAVLLAIASIAVLIYFIHHVSMSLQAPNVIAAVRADLNNSLKAMLRDQDGDARLGCHSPTAANIATSRGDGRTIGSTHDGYVQAIDYDQLVQFACEADIVFELACRPGEYLFTGSALLKAYPSEKCRPETDRLVNEAFICGNQRTAEQDVEYPVRQIVEVAVRALSPGINDPFTAINGVDALGSALCLVDRTGLPAGRRFDSDGTLRVISRVTTYAGLSDLAFNQIRQYGRDSVAVTLRLLEVIGKCARIVKHDDLRHALRRQAEMVFNQGQDADAIPDEQDRADVKRRWETVAKLLPVAVDV